MNIRLIRRTALACLTTSGLLLAAGVPAQTPVFPNKPVTLVVPFAAGGPTDVVARVLGPAMSATLGQTVVIENKAGAGGTVAGAYVAKAAPDGYTLLIHHNGMATAPALYRKLAYSHAIKPPALPPTSRLAASKCMA